MPFNSQRGSHLNIPSSKPLLRARFAAWLNLFASTAAAVTGFASAASAQHHSRVDSLAPFTLAAQAIVMVTRQSPAVMGSKLTEAYLTQPTVMGHGRFLENALALQLMLSLEGWTLDRGELNPGIVGEGYIDRRHPHTFLHEITATLEHGVGAARASITVGKGFAPFGTDDPMGRPFAKYPINHHLAQVLERIIAIAAVRAGPLSLEAGAFNGDEPEGPADAPNRKRLWDSWAARATLMPFKVAEVQMSYASVRSPEFASGGGPDDRKWSASVRYDDITRRRYALAEWARTGEYVGSASAFSFNSLLVEGEAGARGVLVAGRLEITERADEERLTNPFRTPVPGHDFSILGRSGWTITSVRIAAPYQPRSGPGLVPFVELAHHVVRETLRPSGFNPTDFYGSDRIWMLSLGTRVTFGVPHRRMGRYGAAAGQSQSTSHLH